MGSFEGSIVPRKKVSGLRGTIEVISSPSRGILALQK